MLAAALVSIRICHLRPFRQGLITATSISKHAEAVPEAMPPIGYRRASSRSSREALPQSSQHKAFADNPTFALQDEYLELHVTNTTLQVCGLYVYLAFFFHGLLVNLYQLAAHGS